MDPIRPTVESAASRSVAPCTAPTLAFVSVLADKVSEQELKAIDAEVREIVNASAEFAQNDPEPDPSELYTDIYR